MALSIRLDTAKMGSEADTLAENLHRRVVGQDEAIRQIVGCYQTVVTGLRAPNRPAGTFLFLGPTGSGKTRIVEATAESLVGSARAVVKIDCAEFQHSHEIAKLIGSPPGYLGHRETHSALSQEVIDQYQTESVKTSFILFDEIEKASDSLWNLLLGILDTATLTLGDNRKVDFSSAMIFMTGNLGAAEMSAIMKPRFGFTGLTPQLDKRLEERAASSAGAAARRKFNPEFINRLDRIVVFKTLGAAELRRILSIELQIIEGRICRTMGKKSPHFTITEAAKDCVLREGIDQRYGARHLKRALERLLLEPLSNLLATKQIQSGDSVVIDGRDELNELLFFKQSGSISDLTIAAQAGASLAA
ncbi:MAG: ATP-dependent Clp protease ATP-binding subunit [Acidobacteriaceae bacterium]|nr:ATP-dependent Clp protease ATP-binding subunit [Acidobacteriaceae bacterium]